MHGSTVITLKTRWPVLVNEELIDISVIIKILKYLSTAGREVTVRELSRGAHVGPNSVNKYVYILKDKGLIDVRVSGRKKLIKITEKGLEFLVHAARLYSYLGLQL